MDIQSIAWFIQTARCILQLIQTLTMYVSLNIIVSIDEIWHEVYVNWTQRLNTKIDFLFCCLFLKNNNKKQCISAIILFNAALKSWFLKKSLSLVARLGQTWWIKLVIGPASF